VREHLAYLGLATASERLAGELERASAETAAPVEVLERLLAAEVEATSARRLSGRLRFAHYPLDKRLASFEFDFQPSIDRAVIAELSTLRFVEERRNALFLGPPGVGKSHLAIALGIAATEAGFRTYFTTAVDQLPTSRRPISRVPGHRRCGRTPGRRSWSSTSSATCQWTRPARTGCSKSSVDDTSAARSC
jgi:DNA replication protein DnaC